MNAPSLIAPFFTILIGIAAVAIVTRFRQGPLLAPMSVALLMLTAIFGIRPIMMVDAADFAFYGAEVRAGFEAASWIGLTSIVALVLGYAVGSITLADRRLAPAVALSSTSPHFRGGLVAALAILLAWIAIMSFVGSGLDFLVMLFEGRSDAVSTQLVGLPAIVPALPVVAALIVALSRIRAEQVSALTRNETFAYWLVIALTIIPPSALGTRRFLLPSLIAAAVGACATKWYRRVSWKLLAGVFVAFLALAILPFVRSAGSRRGSSDLIGAMVEHFEAQGVAGVFEEFFLSYDTEMFSFIAYVSPRLGSDIPMGWGRGTIGDALLAPLPSSIAPWPSWSNELLARLFGGDCSELYCPVPSLPGLVFFDWGLIGVAVVLFLVGVSASRFDRAFLTMGPVSTSALLVMGAFTIQIVRGNPVSQLWIAAQVWIILVLVDRFIISAASRDTARGRERSGRTGLKAKRRSSTEELNLRSGDTLVHEANQRDQKYSRNVNDRER